MLIYIKLFTSRYHKKFLLLFEGALNINKTALYCSIFSQRLITRQILPCPSASTITIASAIDLFFYLPTWLG